MANHHTVSTRSSTMKQNSYKKKHYAVLVAIAWDQEVPAEGRVFRACVIPALTELTHRIPSLAILLQLIKIKITYFILNVMNNCIK